MLKRVMDRFHMVMHLLIGLMIAYAFHLANPSLSLFYLMAVSILGSFLPDMDHIVYWYTYGRNTSYARHVRQLLSQGKFIAAASFCATNHKQLTGLYSHSLFTLAASGVAAVIIFPSSSMGSVFFTAVGSHFLFDVVEDLLLLKRLNTNWWGSFSKR